VPAPIRLVFDFISPYAYVGWKALPAVARRHERAIEPVPVLFAALLHAHGQKGPAEIPAKRVYAFKDAYRKASKLGLDGVVPPPTHPFNPLLALRVASLPMPAEERTRLIDALFDGAWAGAGGAETAEQVIAAAARADLDGASLVARAGEPPAKERVRAATDAAIAAGVFGVPSFAVEDEIFWGVDALPHLDDWLAGADPVPADAALRWGSLASSADRLRRKGG
jgi:2-hydroxychromene-2-carboxylate isomerase